MDTIQIRGARTHNLKDIDVDLPRNQLIVITGLSGSGKSSLAFDTIYAEGQRRYVESLSSYARQFLSVMEKPDVDHIEGLSPGRSSYLLKRLRTHGLIKKVAHTYKYYLTKLGRRVLVTALVIREYFVQPTLVRNAL